MVLIVLLLAAFVLNLTVGNADIDWMNFSRNEVAQKLIWDYRLPKAIAALLSGIAVSVSGLLLQELFRNPLADPSVLGITSASGLGVAMVIFLSGLLGLSAMIQSPWLICLASFAGALLALLLIVYFSARLNSTASLIIMGMMVAGFSSAVIGLLQYFADSEQIKSYLVWTFGSLSGLGWEQITVFFLCTAFGLAISLFTLRGVSGLRLGEDYAHSMGINIPRARMGILVSSALLTAATTAFVGPVAFLGLAVPHICRMLFRETAVGKLYVLVFLSGAVMMLVFAWLSQLFPNGALPVNIITSLIGTPIVVSILLNRNRYNWHE